MHNFGIICRFGFWYHGVDLFGWNQISIWNKTLQFDTPDRDASHSGVIYLLFADTSYIAFKTFNIVTECLILFAVLNFTTEL